MKVLILGINGFIGHRLTETILSKRNFEVSGIDLLNYRLKNCLPYPRLSFKQGDVILEKDWLLEQLDQCDVVLPFISVCSKMTTRNDFLFSYERRFQFLLDLIKQVSRKNKRLIFPSTSEVYINNPEALYKEDFSNSVFDPIMNKWISSTTTQLLERIIFTYGKNEGLKYTIFRPFNWIGPAQDNVFTQHPLENSHIFSKIISDIVHRRNILLDNGGDQKQSFTYIEDGIEALIKMIENEKEGNGQIFNIGNPDNVITIKELAEKIKQRARTYSKYQEAAQEVKIISLWKKHGDDQHSFDLVNDEIPTITKAKQLLQWQPRTDIDIAINNTLDFYLQTR